MLSLPWCRSAAKGVLARLDPSLMPAREDRLRVVAEKLSVVFGRVPFAGDVPSPPLASDAGASPSRQETKSDTWLTQEDTR